MSKKKKIDQGYLHEAMDRTIIIANNLEDYVVKSPSCKSIPKAQKLILKGVKNIIDAYKEFGKHVKQ